MNAFLARDVVFLFRAVIPIYATLFLRHDLFILDIVARCFVPLNIKSLTLAVCRFE